MSRVFEFLQKLNGSPSQSNSEPGSENVENILSVLQRPQAEVDNSAPDSKVILEHVDTVELRLEPADRLVFHTDPQGLAADRFRLLRLRLRERSKSGKLKSILITSPVPHDGKSMVAMNLATALAEYQRPPVLLIDADVHHSSLTQRLGLTSNTGLVRCLTAGMHAMQALRKIEPLGWYFLPAGETEGGACPGLLHTDAFSRVMKEVSPYFEWIVIDCAPIIPLTDAASIMKHADGALLVARAGVTSGKALEDAVNLLGRERVVGVVVNGIEALERKYSRYHQYYYSKAKASEAAGPATQKHSSSAPVSTGLND